jgi:hypothetical protein
MRNDAALSISAMLSTTVVRALRENRVSALPVM